jgi:TatD DNase family protein
MKSIIDSHAHLAWDSYAEDQKDVIARAFQSGVVQIVHAGVDLVSIPEMIKLSDDYEQIYLGVGLHPHEAKLWDSQAEEALRQAAAHPKVVAIGECGLDFYYNHSDRESQINAFRAQIRLARQLAKPLIIHTRDAWPDTFAILEEEEAGKVGGVFHCFTGSPAQLPQIKKLDFYVSFSGIVTFNKAQDIQDAAKLVDENRMLVETDCPYLAPQPMRGKRNEPAYVWMVASKLAELRNVSQEQIADVTVKNTRRLFQLPEIKAPT